MTATRLRIALSRITEILLSRFRQLLSIIIVPMACVAAMATLSSCHDDYSELPREIQSFISAYYPGTGVSSFKNNQGEYTVNLENSATFEFNEQYYWKSLNGNGNTLPEQFLYDQLPQPLYSYIVTTDNLDEVYIVSRGGGKFVVTFLDYAISYNTVNEEITPVVRES